MTALFAGSFDPPTYGHIDLIKRAALLFPTLIVGVAENSTKNPLLKMEERVQLLKELTQDIPHCQVVVISGLVVEYAKKNGIKCLIRGLRGPSDLENELALASANKKLSGIETLFLQAEETYSLLSSTLIREILRFGGPVNAFVPSVVAAALKGR